MKALLFSAMLIVIGFDLSAEKLNQNQLIHKFNQTFNKTKTLRADFVESHSSGAKVDGKFYLKRKNKMRINYNEPIRDFIVSDGRLVFYWDDKMKQQSHTTVGSTIVGFLMKENFLDQSQIKILSLNESKNSYDLVFTEPEFTGQGKIKLYFNKNTYELFEWQIEDFEGNWTAISLHNIERNIALTNSLFYFKKPR